MLRKLAISSPHIPLSSDSAPIPPLFSARFFLIGMGKNSVDEGLETGFQTNLDMIRSVRNRWEGGAPVDKWDDVLSFKPRTTHAAVSNDLQPCWWRLGPQFEGLLQVEATRTTTTYGTIIGSDAATIVRPLVICARPAAIAPSCLPPPPRHASRLDPHRDRPLRAQRKAPDREHSPIAARAAAGSGRPRKAQYLVYTKRALSGGAGWGGGDEGGQGPDDSEAGARRAFLGDLILSSADPDEQASPSSLP
jgi:hypothetical protein